MYNIKTKFPLGTIVITSGVSEMIGSDDAFKRICIQCLKRHAKCDWGNLVDDDKKLNDQALKNGERVMSVYDIPSHPTIWIITEADRRCTTILFPHEY